MGPVRPDGFLRHRCHKRGVEEVAAETERVLYATQRNLVRLTHQVSMIAIEDLPEEMQRCVVGVPRDWVCVKLCCNSCVNIVLMYNQSFVYMI